MASDQFVQSTAGGEFNISIPENPTTGFVWQCAQIPEGLEIVRRDFIKESASKIGGGGTRVFTVLSHAAGAFELIFTLRRGPQPVVDQFTAHITVN